MALEDKFRPEDVEEMEAKFAAIDDEIRQVQKDLRKAFDWDEDLDMDDDMWGWPTR